MEIQPTELEWKEVKTYFDQILESYLELIGNPSANPLPALALTFRPLLSRYNEGARSPELYEAMESVQ